MSTLGSATIGTAYSIAPATARSREVAVDPTAPVAALPAGAAGLGDISGGLADQGMVQVPAWMVMGQAVAANAAGPAQAAEAQAEQDAVVEGAISMPARPLAEIISQIRAVVDAHRTSPSRGSKQPAGATRTGPARRTPQAALAKVAARAYTNAQQLADHQAPTPQVDIYHGARSDKPPVKKTGTR